MKLSLDLQSRELHSLFINQIFTNAPSLEQILEESFQSLQDDPVCGEHDCTPEKRVGKKIHVK